MKKQQFEWDNFYFLKEIHNFQRPFLLRFFKIVRPVFVAFLARKPETLMAFNRLPFRVNFDIFLF